VESTLDTPIRWCGPGAGGTEIQEEICEVSHTRSLAVGAHFDRNVADFVISERSTLGVVAVIGLDDHSHVTAAVHQLDAITKAAGYPTFQFPSRQKPAEAKIAALVQHARAWTSK
jgi:hypothetical protein